MRASEIARLIGDLDNQATSAVEKALSEGEEPVDLLQQGVIRGLEIVGEKFESQDYFLPELITGGKITEACIALINPHLPRDQSATLGVVVIGAVQGDFHDLGYGLVAMQLELAGFEVHQLGVDIPPMTFIDKAQGLNADIIGLSASFPGDHRWGTDQPGGGRRDGRRRLGAQRGRGREALPQPDGAAGGRCFCIAVEAGI
jgi:5-methyltetrahydrofolate--homocysteine methyltransferase